MGGGPPLAEEFLSAAECVAAVQCVVPGHSGTGVSPTMTYLSPFCRMGPGPGYPMMVGYPMVPPQLAAVGPLLMPGTGSIRWVETLYII